MHYDAIVNDHGLKHDPFKALIAPRPIGWIASVSRSGICNLAPYSFFNAVSDRPHYVMFSSKNLKDSVRNIQETGEFTCSMSTWDTRDAMSITSAPVPPGVDEFSLSSLTATASKFVKPPRVKESPAAFECRYWRAIELPDVAPGSASPASWHAPHRSKSALPPGIRPVPDSLCRSSPERSSARLVPPSGAPHPPSPPSTFRRFGHLFEHNGAPYPISGR